MHKAAWHLRIGVRGACPWRWLLSQAAWRTDCASPLPGSGTASGSAAPSALRALRRFAAGPGHPRDFPVSASVPLPSPTCGRLRGIDEYCLGFFASGPSPFQRLGNHLAFPGMRLQCAGLFSGSPPPACCMLLRRAGSPARRRAATWGLPQAGDQGLALTGMQIHTPG